MLKKITACVFLLAALASCKKENKGTPDASYSGNTTVGFSNYKDESTGGFGLYTVGLPIKDSFVTVTVNVKLANTTAPADRDIAVYLTKSNISVTNYNTKNGTSYVNISDVSSGIMIDLSKPVIIKAGQRVGALPIKINVVKLGLNATYALGLAIANVDGAGIDEYQNKLVVVIVARNMYDGRYVLKGAFYHPNVANQHNWTFDVEMHTTGPNSVKMFDPVYFGDYLHPWLTGTGSLSVTAFGLQSPDYTIDPVTNKVTVQNVAPGAVTFYTMSPNYNSRYDPATKTIYARWGYNYAPGPTFDPSTNREWTDTLIYVGPR